MKNIKQVFLGLLVVALLFIGVFSAQAAEIPDVTQYSYTVKPLLSPFYHCLYVQTDNPDPTSFRLVDRDSIYYEEGDLGSIEIPISGSMSSVADADPGTYYILENIFPDVVYEDESTYRVPGGYIFHCRQAYSDGGEFVLLQKTYGGSNILSDRFEPTDVTIPCPQMMSGADYLIETYTTEDMTFFEKLDAVQSGLSSVSVYPRDVKDINKPSSYPYPLLAASPYPELILNEHYEMYGDLIYGLLSSYTYPFVLDSLGFPGTMSTVAQLLEPECTVESGSSHAYVYITFDGETKSYGGAGAGGRDPLYTNRVEKEFTFQGGEGDMAQNGTVDQYCALLRGYGPIAAEDAEKYRDLIAGDTYKNTIQATGGTWIKVGVEGWGFGKSFAYVVPEGSNIRVASDAWVDGRYVSNKETIVLYAEFEDYPNADIVLHDVTYMDYYGNVYTQDLYYRYDSATDTWISSYYAVSDLSASQRQRLTLTREEVEALHVDQKSSYWPEDSLVYDGSEYPGTPFHHVSVTGVEILEDQALELDVGETRTLAVKVYPENADDDRVRWESSDPSVVEVTSIDGGIILAVNKGTVTLTAWSVDGKLTDTCTVTVPDPCPKFGHSFEDYILNADATCEANGTKIVKCKYCDVTDTVEDVGSILGHSFGAWEEVNAATCTEKGERTRACETCGKVETWEVQATGHRYTAVVTEPTCTEAGYTTYTCVCGDTYTDSETPAYGHSYSGGKCAICGIDMDESQAEPSVWPRNAVIYQLEDWAEGLLEIPAEYPQSHQIRVENAENVSFWVYSGNSVKVTADGLVTPRVNTFYWYGNTGYPYPLEGEEYDKVTYSKYFGQSVIRVTADGRTFDITVDVCGYGQACADKVMEDYLAENYSEDMTIEEKMDVLCRFPTQYAYDSSCYDGEKMIVTGGGDYYASAEAIVMLCEKAGFEAKVRDSYYDSGTRSANNVIVTVGAEDYYILDAGFSGEVPRKYLVTHRTSPFVYKQVEGGIEICQFDGTTTETFEIPARIDGYRVVGLGGSAFSYNSLLKKVILPDTLQYIKSSAFYRTGLEEIHIPANVTSIGTSVFARCDSLMKLSVDENNTAYMAKDGVIYTKDETILVSAHICAEPELPDTLKTVEDYAFRYNSALTQITLPDSVDRVGRYAFGDCSNLTRVDLGNVKTVDYRAFFQCPKLTWVYVPETVETIGDRALGYKYYSTLTEGVVISGHKGTAAETYATENGIPFVDVNVPQWVETTAGKRYFVNGIPVTGSYEIDGESCYFTDDGFLCTHAKTELKGKTPSTCAVEGYTGDTVCKACGCVVTQGTAVEKLAHSFGSWVTNTSATCEEKGQQRRDCYNCDAFETRETDALGHDYKAVVAAPTCTEKGYTTHTCSRCRDSYVDTYVDELGHSFTGYISDGNATCTEDGTKTAKCDRCEVTDTVTDTDSAKGHSYGAWTETKAATCTAKGTEVRYCADCDVFETREISELGHNYDAVVTEPTCTEKGYTTYTCTRCDDSYVDTYTELLEHAWGNGTVTVRPSVDRDGEMIWFCLNCPASRTEVLPATGECDGGETCVSRHFTDMNPMAWYHRGVDFAVANKLFNGMTDTTFEPDTTMTRAMLVTVLWRYSGSVEEGENVFDDVADNAWFAKAVAWAAQNGIVNGVDETHFAPDDVITREQMATILYRYCGMLGIDTETEGDISGFPDADQVGAYAVEPLKWAVATGLINGVDGNLAARGNATRAQVATILMRLIETL